MNGELLTALERIEREKGISKEILFEAIESALASAAKKVIDDPDVAKEDITVTVDPETGSITVFSDGEEIENERFGRIAAQTAKQVIIQKIREAERDVIFEKYVKKEGSIVSGAVHRFEKGNIIVELDDTEAVLAKNEQIPRERFRQGEQIRAYLVNVDRGMGGPEIKLSRTDEGFVKKLFELEVPEISQGIVEIKSIAREAGERTKIAVCSKDEKVDPVGACVGMRGSRVRDIVKELHGERIDIVRWDGDLRDYLIAAVNPAEVSKMVLDRQNNTITLTVPQDQLSLLIGKKGRNIRLASKLLGWELIAEAVRETLDVPITNIKGIGKKTMENLENSEYDNVESLLQLGVDGLLALEGIGQKTAEKIIVACEAAYTAAAEMKAAMEAEARAVSEAAEAEDKAAAEALAAEPVAKEEVEDSSEQGASASAEAMADKGSVEEEAAEEGTEVDAEESTDDSDQSLEDSEQETEEETTEEETVEEEAEEPVAEDSTEQGASASAEATVDKGSVEEEVAEEVAEEETEEAAEEEAEEKVEEEAIEEVEEQSEDSMEQGASASAEATADKGSVEEETEEKIEEEPIDDSPQSTEEDTKNKE
ncbi:MAG: transcription termination factor NusA [Candidatus Tantalella remota]|nr:transcription termination factor NusA [Candidatus Tantalella remota]